MIALASFFHLIFKNIAVTLGEQVIVHRPFNRFRYAYSEVVSVGIRSASGSVAGDELAEPLFFTLELPDMKIEIPINRHQADDLLAIFDPVLE